MQNVVSEIFDALGGVTAVATGLNAPVQTVDSWKGKGRKAGNGKPAIPTWRRPDVLRFASETGKLAALSSDALEYLQSPATQNKASLGKDCASGRKGEGEYRAKASDFNPDGVPSPERADENTGEANGSEAGCVRLELADLAAERSPTATRAHDACGNNKPDTHSPASPETLGESI